jgi:uncharacterized protein YacL (UPF0231 family)
MKLQKGHKYLVSWFDITTDNTWRTIANVFAEIDKLKPSQNTWTYLGKHENYYVFTSGMNSDGEQYDYHAIPKTVITKIKELK